LHVDAILQSVATDDKRLGLCGGIFDGINWAGVDGFRMTFIQNEAPIAGRELLTVPTPALRMLHGTESYEGVMDLTANKNFGKLVTKKMECVWTRPTSPIKASLGSSIVDIARLAHTPAIATVQRSPFFYAVDTLIKAARTSRKTYLTARLAIKDGQLLITVTNVKSVIHGTATVPFDSLSTEDMHLASVNANYLVGLLRTGTRPLTQIKLSEFGSDNTMMLIMSYEDNVHQFVMPIHEGH